MAWPLWPSFNRAVKTEIEILRGEGIVPKGVLVWNRVIEMLDDGVIGGIGDIHTLLYIYDEAPDGSRDMSLGLRYVSCSRSFSGVSDSSDEEGAVPLRSVSFKPCANASASMASLGPRERIGLLRGTSTAPNGEGGRLRCTHMTHIQYPPGQIK